MQIIKTRWLRTVNSKQGSKKACRVSLPIMNMLKYSRFLPEKEKRITTISAKQQSYCNMSTSPNSCSHAR